MKARIDISGDCNGNEYDFYPYEIKYSIASNINKGDTILLRGINNDEIEVTVKDKFFDLVDDMLILDCIC